MAKIPKDLELLNTIWLDLHERQGKSAEAAALARSSRQRFSDDQEMAGELAAMEMVTAGAAAKNSLSFAEAYPHLVQSAQVVQDAFPLGESEEAARQKGNALDPVYGEVSAQAEMLRSYYHLIERLSRILKDEAFNRYASLLWNFLSGLLSEMGKEDSLLLLTIEYGTYDNAISAYRTFLKESGADPSRHITANARMLNRALVESDYGTAVTCFTQAIQALAADRRQLAHFGKQIASNVRADKTIAFQEKLRQWSEETNQHNLQPFTELTNLVFVGLGHDRVEKLSQ